MTAETDTIHTDTCRCSLHATVQLRRDAAYRHLAQTILGPGAPTDTGELLHALQAHAQRLRARSADRGAREGLRRAA